MYVSFGYDADFSQLSGQAARIFYDFRPSKKKKMFLVPARFIF